MPPSDFVERPERLADLRNIGRVCRLGLATRGNTHLAPEDVLEAVDRGVTYLNWCGHPDGLQQAVRQLGSKRRDVAVAVQLQSSTADAARRELDGFLDDLDTGYLDVVTYYYVEQQREWQRITSSGGAAEAMEAARDDGRVRAIGMTSHQRDLAAQAAASGRLDLLMVRYNAAHRGAERQVFPVTDEYGISTVAFTCQRWGALKNPTPDDPPGFTPPPAPEWYRFVLCHPSVSVALMAPNGREELAENLQLLDDWRGMTADDYAALKSHGDRVYRHGGSFP